MSSPMHERPVSSPCSSLSRRQFCIAATSAASYPIWRSTLCNDSQQSNDSQNGNGDAEFEFNYILASCLYGYMYIGEILPEVRKVGAASIDIWPKIHGNQREQLDDLGEEKFAQMLAEHDVKLGCLTQYKLGPFKLQNEIKLAKRFNCRTIVTEGRGPRALRGGDLKSAVARFVEQMKPHLAVAAENGVTIAIENHANNLFESADALQWLVELRPSKHLGVAFAPYHLPQDANEQSKLIKSLGNAIEVFYAWQHGKGCHQRLPKNEELLQLPGRGELDFAPLIAALKQIEFTGWTEIFMHPFPRGIPIFESAAEITGEINRSREYLERLR